MKKITDKDLWAWMDKFHSQPVKTITKDEVYFSGCGAEGKFKTCRDYVYACVDRARRKEAR